MLNVSLAYVLWYSMRLITLSYIAPPWSVTADDDDRRQRPLLVWPSTLYVGGPVIRMHKLR